MGPNNATFADAEQLPPQFPDRKKLDPEPKPVNVALSGKPLMVQFMPALAAADAPKLIVRVALVKAPFTTPDPSVTGVAPMSV